jgi:hypothetical protein
MKICEYAYITEDNENQMYIKYLCCYFLLLFSFSLPRRLIVCIWLSNNYQPKGDENSLKFTWNAHGNVAGRRMKQITNFWYNPNEPTSFNCVSKSILIFSILMKNNTKCTANDGKTITNEFDSDFSTSAIAMNLKSRCFDNHIFCSLQSIYYYLSAYLIFKWDDREAMLS